MRSPPPARSEGIRGRARAVALGGATLAFLGLAFDVKPLTVPGIGLLLLSLIARTWARVGARGVTVRRRLVERHVVEGDLLESVLEVQGRRLWLSGATVEDALSGRELPVETRRWMRARRGSYELPVIAEAGRRGRHTFAPPRLLSSDPLGLSVVTHGGQGLTDEVIVLPRTESVNWVAGARRQASGDEARGQALTGAGEIDGLREYRLGAPAARIHWPALARGAGLMERRVVSAAEGRPLIVVDPRCEAPPRGLDDLDAAIRAAASLVLELARRGGCSMLLPRLRVPIVVGADLRAWPGLRTRLALVEAERHRHQAPAIRPEIVRGPLLYVAGTGAIDLPGPATVSAYTVILVVPNGTAGDHGDPIFEVAGCAGYQLRSRMRRRAA